MILSIIIPVYNEEKTILKVLEKIKKNSSTNFEYEIIVIDDGSSDRTRELLEKNNNLYSKLLTNEVNQGKGYAVKKGILSSSGTHIIFQDADLEYNPQEYPVLIQPILDGKADVVFGSRFQGGQAHRVLYFWHFLGNKALTLLSNMFTNLNLTDMETCYKVFRNEVLQQIEIKENRFGVEPELTAKVSKLGCRIYEVGISYSGRTYSEGKKINWKDGVQAIWCILKYNLIKSSHLSQKKKI